MLHLTGSPRSASAQLIKHLESRGILPSDDMPVNSTRLFNARLTAARRVREATQEALSLGFHQRSRDGSQVFADSSLSPAFRHGQTFPSESSGQCKKRCLPNETTEERLGSVWHDAVGSRASSSGESSQVS